MRIARTLIFYYCLLLSFIHRQSILFEISDLDTKLRFIEQKLLRDVADLPDEEVENVKTDAVASNKTLEKVSNRILKLIAGSTISDSEKIEKVKKRYEEIILSQKHFSDKLDSEYKKRELGKLKSFNQSKLNIQLSKFKGYTSCLDIYSFKRDFDKLHEKSVPTYLMADVLKNNYLEGAALALVKHKNDISEIWKRLKTAYGDVKFLLSNKLSELSNLDKLWKLKDGAIISESLSKVINVIKDLMNLAETHNIKPRLYHGDGVNQIYKLIGNKKTTQWLQQIKEEMPKGKELWTRLLKFLERELRIQQQKQLINFSDENKPVDPATKEDKVSRLYLSNHQEKNSNYCYICGATDHISTNSPNNSKLIKYFICETFAKMTPLDRFKTLRKKNLCFQCLFPGAEISIEKDVVNETLCVSTRVMIGIL